MDILLDLMDMEHWRQQILTSAWIFVTFINYILFLAFFVVPFMVGIFTLAVATYLATRLPPAENVVPRIGDGFLRSQIGNAFLLQFLRKQRNEYYFHSVPNTYNLDSLLPPQWLVNTLLSNYLKPYTTSAVERILVVVPPVQTLLNSLRKTGTSPLQQLEHGQSPIIYSDQRNFSESSSKTCTGSLKLDRSLMSLNKLSYFDLSMRKYRDSPQVLYKEKQPIHFKFWPDVQ